MATMGRASISMHSLRPAERRAIANVIVTGIAIVIFTLSQQPAAVSQATASVTNAPNAGGVAEVRSAPNGNAQSSMVTVPEDFATLKLTAGFLLNIEVYGEPDLSGHVRVDS